MKDYKSIFNLIENTLRKENGLTNSRFDKIFKSFKRFVINKYKNMTDGDIYWALVKVIFYSGMRAATVSGRMDAIKKYFYDFEKVRNFSDKTIKSLLNNSEVIRNERKIRACVNNAREFEVVLSKYKSFGKYLESFKSLDKLCEDLQARFEFLGGITVNHFLMDLGFDLVKPDRVLCRIFSRLGLIRNPSDIVGAISVGLKMARATGYPARYIDIVLVKYGQIGEEEGFYIKDGICLEKKPKCNVCGVKKHCKWALKTK